MRTLADKDEALAAVESFQERVARRSPAPDVELAARELAQLCSFPFLLTPELVHFLRERFMTRALAWEIGVDLLLDPSICRPTGREQYAMHESVQRLLRQEAETLIKEQGQRLQNFLLDYVADYTRRHLYFSPEEEELQRWFALTVTPNGRVQATKEISELLSRLPEGTGVASGAYYVQAARHLSGTVPQMDALARVVDDREEIQPSEVPVEVTMPGLAIRCGLWSPDGTSFVAGGEGGIFRIDEAGRSPQRAEGEPSVASMIFDGEQRLCWTSPAGQVSRYLSGFRRPDSVRTVSESTAMVLHRGEIIFGDSIVEYLAERGTRFGEPGARLGVTCFASRGNTLAFGNVSGNVHAIVDLPSGSHGGSWVSGRSVGSTSNSITDLAWNPDGTRLAAASASGEIRIYARDSTNVINLRPNEQSTGSMPLDDFRFWGSTATPLNPVVSVSFSPDNRILASLDQAGVVCLWRTDLWEEVGRWTIEAGDETGGVRFHPTESRLAAWTGGGDTVRYYDIDVDRLCPSFEGAAFLSSAGGSLVEEIAPILRRLGWRVTIDSEERAKALAIRAQDATRRGASIYFAQAVHEASFSLDELRRGAPDAGSLLVLIEPAQSLISRDDVSDLGLAAFVRRLRGQDLPAGRTALRQSLNTWIDWVEHQEGRINLVGDGVIHFDFAIPFRAEPALVGARVRLEAVNDDSIRILLGGAGIEVVGTEGADSVATLRVDRIGLRSKPLSLPAPLGERTVLFDPFLDAEDLVQLRATGHEHVTNDLTLVPSLLALAVGAASQVPMALAAWSRDGTQLAVAAGREVRILRFHDGILHPELTRRAEHLVHALSWPPNAPMFWISGDLMENIGNSETRRSALFATLKSIEGPEPMGDPRLSGPEFAVFGDRPSSTLIRAQFTVIGTMLGEVRAYHHLGEQTLDALLRPVRPIRLKDQRGDQILSDLGGPVVAILPTRNQSWFLAVTEIGRVVAFDLNGSVAEAFEETRPKFVRRATIAPDRATLLLEDDDRSRLIDIATGNRVPFEPEGFDPKTDRILAFHPKEPIVAVAVAGNPEPKLFPLPRAYGDHSPLKGDDWRGSPVIEGIATTALLWSAERDDAEIETLEGQLRATGLVVQRFGGEGYSPGAMRQLFSGAAEALANGPVLVHLRGPVRLDTAGGLGFSDGKVWSRLEDFIRGMGLDVSHSLLVTVDSTEPVAMQPKSLPRASTVFMGPPVDGAPSLTEWLRRAFAGEAYTWPLDTLTIFGLLNNVGMWLRSGGTGLIHHEPGRNADLVRWNPPAEAAALSGLVVIGLGEELATDHGLWEFLRYCGVDLRLPDVLDFEAQVEAASELRPVLIVDLDKNHDVERGYEDLVAKFPQHPAILYEGPFGTTTSSYPWDARVNEPTALVRALARDLRTPFANAATLEGCQISGGAWAPDGSDFVVAGGERIAQIMASGEIRFHVPPGSRAVAIGRGMRRLVVGLETEGPVFFEPESGKWTIHERSLIGPIEDIGIADNLTVACSRKDGAVAYHREGTEYKVMYTAPNSGAICVAAHPKLARCAVGYENGAIRFSHQMAPSVVHRGAVNAITWNRSGSIFASASSDHSVNILNIDRQSNTTLDHTDVVVGVTFSSDDRRLASLELSGTVRIWNCESWQEIASFQIGTAGLYGGVLFHPNLPILATYAESSSRVDFRRIETDVPPPAPIIDRPVKQWRALVVSGDIGYQYQRRDNEIVAAALRSRGFTVSTLDDPSENVLVSEIDSILSQCGPDDFFLVHVNGFGKEDGDQIWIDVNRDKYDLRKLNDALERLPSLRALVVLDAGRTPFIEAVAEKLTRCAVLGIDLEESHVLGYGYLSYAFAQALSSTRGGTIPTVEGVVQTVRSILDEYAPPKRPQLVWKSALLEALQLAEAPPTERRPWLGKRILWVDDRPGNNRYLVDRCTDSGAITTLALDTDQALRLYDSYSFDAIVTDMSRPPDRLAGYKLLAGLSERSRPIPPCIIFAGSSRREHHNMAVVHGAVGSTDDGAQVLRWLERAFEGEKRRDEIAKEQAQAWTEFLERGMREGRTGLSEERLASFLAWLDQYGAYLEAGKVLAAWLLATYIREPVRSHVLSWLEQFSRHREAESVLIAWLTVSPDSSDVQSYCEAWFHRYRTTKNTTELLLVWQGKEKDATYSRNLLTWLQDETPAEMLLAAMAIWKKLPTRNIKVGNLARQVKSDDPRGRFRWRLFLDESPEFVQSVRSVRYILHDSFALSVRMTTDASTDFSLRSEGWGTFEVRMIITFRDGTQVAASHHLSFDAPSKAGRHEV
ncbi:pYEATS domain-containing protein [Fimbriimonas ginsengisoli]|uniref:Response regulator receiver protein n=1 Tax=Fimbriimonas ginsengisoli Gsoil 348 TaxID=661478 RepID=A0A068NJT4_FIMGI|nr:pYEATS domain-containing protein [Fimbriimonas ginsengisoli]AIE83766.1 response regulator receiver protein [Fimbriimonas ginsengisoli Gsoil 348]